MIRTASITSLFLLFFLVSAAQGKFYTKTGKITFFSTTAVENIEAINKSAVAVIDSRTGDVQFVVLMKGFEFKKALMQEDFNKDYIESSKYPKSEFKGQITNNSEINYAADGVYTAKVKGKLTIHGETKDIEVTGTITVKEGSVYLKCIFNVLIADYKIKVRKLYKDSISSSIRVTVESSLELLK